MNKLFAERFKSARIMSGLSLQTLADKIGNRISRQALHKYEKGDSFPDSEILGLLCEAFGVRPEFFTRESIVELGTIEFRKIAKLPSKEQSRVIEITKEFLTRYLELEELLGIQKTFSNPLDGENTITSFDQVEEYANFIRKEWKLGDDPIANVVELLENNNIKVIEIDAEDEFDGLQTWINGKNIPVIVLNIGRLKSSDRKRFTALHELGHLILPLNNLPEKVAEKYCHRFAAAMLLPKVSANKEIGVVRNKISLQELGMIKQKYGISIQAIIYRAKDLNIITNSYFSNLFFLINQMGWKVLEPFEYEGKENSNRFDQLIYRALSEEIISMSKAASLKNQKLAEFRSNTMIIG